MIKRINSDILNFFLVHFLFTVMGIVYCVVEGDSLKSFSFIFGALFAALNVTLLVIVLKSLFNKKSVALPVGVIVFKYAVLGLVLFGIVQHQLLDTLYFVLGMSLLIPSSLIFSLIYVRTRQKETKGS